MADTKARIAEARRLTAEVRARIEESLAELTSVRTQLGALSGGAPQAAPGRGLAGPASAELDLGATPADAQNSGEAELLLDNLEPPADEGANQ